MMAADSEGKMQRVAFTIQTIDCIACTPILRKALSKILGVREVSELPMTSKVIVTFDAKVVDLAALHDEIVLVSGRAGLGGKVIFER